MRALRDRRRCPARLRARAHEKPGAIIVTDLPHGVEKGGDRGVIRQIVQLVATGGLPELRDLRDFEGGRGVRIEIELDPGADARAVLDSLYARTSLETTFAVDLVARIDGAPVRMSLPEMIRRWIGGRDPGPLRRELEDVAARHGDPRRTSL